MSNKICNNSTNLIFIIMRSSVLWLQVTTILSGKQSNVRVHVGKARQSSIMRPAGHVLVIYAIPTV